MTGRLEGKISLITGAGSGIGLACARRFVREGARVLGTDISDSGRAEVEGCGASFLLHDVAREADWVRLVADLRASHGRLDILVNNAGITFAQPIEDVELDSWNRLLAINLTGTMLGCKHAVRAMRENPGGPSGSIVNMSSMSGFIGLSQAPAYTASKGAVRLLTKSVAVRCATEYRGIRCNSVHPGAIDTPIHERRLSNAPDRDAALAMMDAMQPIGRMGTADEIAACVAFLASDDASLVTGTELVADGGWLADGGASRLPPTREISGADGQ